MPLPVSKSALDRLGVRLAAGDSVSEEDLVGLAQVVDAYQDVLNGVKRRLSGLGFSATTRMKTTGTLVDKLRRESARLSQVQDLAGARIVVPDRITQDEATDKIRAAFEAAGCPCKIIDRRGRPSHGYRAVHVVTQVDKVPVEIQVRTDLQDSWAQLVERLADMWGRGIRYGEEPEAPNTPLGGEQQTGSRQDVIHVLMRLSNLTAKFEEAAAMYARAARNAAELAALADALTEANAANDLVVEDVFSEQMLSQLELWVASFQSTDAAAFFAEWRRMTVVQFGAALRQTYGLVQPDLERAAAQIPSSELELRAILSQLADAIGEG